MKTIRNYRFVLTVLDNEQLNAGECRIANDEVSGERMFASECHYYAEKNIIEAVKEADKHDALGEYYGHTYCIYKETKPKTETIEREEDGKKITETRELPTGNAHRGNYRRQKRHQHPLRRVFALAGEWPKPASAARLCWRAQL